MRAIFPIAIGAALAAMSAPADSEPVHGRVLVQDIVSHDGQDSLAAALAGQDRNDLHGDLRLTWTPRRGPWHFDLAYRATVVGGDQPGLTADLATLGIAPASPPLTAWDGSDTLINKRDISVVQKMDRLSVSYSSPHLVLRAGRQALTWGAGLVFHPMDLFDPFSPDATDVEFKPGTDMLYGQYLFDNGSDVQAVAVPRPARRNESLTADASSAALLFRRRIGPVQTSWLMARDRGDTVVGLGVTGTLGGASWTAEVVPTRVSGGGMAVSALLNLSSAGTLWGHDTVYFAEVYRNGFGIEKQDYSLPDLPPDLVRRQQRGQVFTSRRDYVATGADIQMTPLLGVSPTFIASLGDQSAIALVQANYSLSNDLLFVAGAQAPVGAHGTEFGGIGLEADSAPYLETPTRLYVQIRYYF